MRLLIPAMIVAAMAGGCVAEPGEPGPLADHRVVQVDDNFDPTTMGPEDARAMADYLLYETDDYPASFPPVAPDLHHVDESDVVPYQVSGGECTGTGQTFEKCTWDMWVCRTFELCSCSCGAMVAREGECGDYSCS